MKKYCSCASVHACFVRFVCLAALFIQGCTGPQETTMRSSAPSTRPAAVAGATTTTLSHLNDKRPGDGSAERDDVSQKKEPQDAVVLRDLFGQLPSKSDPTPSEYSQLRAVAEQNDPNAQYRLAVFEYRTNNDAHAMIEWLRKAATQNHTKAQVALGNAHQRGIGVPQDNNEAVAWYRRAAHLGDRDAQFLLGLSYWLGTGVSQNFSEAANWFRKAAEQDHVWAQFWLGTMYRKGQGVPQDGKEAVKWLTKAAEAGQLHAQSILGLIYYNGEDIPRNLPEAAKWFRRAGLQGCADAQIHLGRMYDGGMGVPQDLAEAANWFKKAAEQGRVYAQVVLGGMYYDGRGIPQDQKEGAKWFRRAAEQGHAPGQIMLGLVYRDGKGLVRDYQEAAKWFRRAAEQGDADAQCELGRAYAGGKGVPQDFTEAAKWFTRAAEQGHQQSQFLLCGLYASGRGVLEDYSEAYKWMLVAAMKGMNREDEQAKEILRSSMTPSQIEEGQRRAGVFIGERERCSRQAEQRAKSGATTASGFFITTTGYVLTACHAIENAVRMEIIHNGKTYPAEAVLRDQSTDVAVLKLEEGEYPCLQLVSGVAVRPGDSVFTLGFPQVSVQGMEAKFTEGSISALSGLGDSPRFFQISVPVQPGNSGGPLLNENGEVVGLIVSRLDDVAALMATGAVPQTVNYALKNSFILPLMESVPGLAEKLPKGSPPKDRSTAIENARKAVVLIVGYSDGSDPSGSSFP